MGQQEQIKITVHVQPNSKQNRVIGFRDGVLHVKIAAPPVNGKANKELVRFLSTLLGVSKSGLGIEKGLTSTTKTISITGPGQDRILRALAKYQTH